MSHLKDMNYMLVHLRTVSACLVDSRYFHHIIIIPA